MLGSVRVLVVLLTVLSLWLVACGTTASPVLGEPPTACVDEAFGPGARIDWAGRADPEAIGLFEVDPPQNQEADIYVGRPRDALATDTAVFCVVQRDGITVGPLPPGWQPPA